MSKAVFFFLLFFCYNLNAKIWQVGPLQVYNYCSQVAPLVSDGDTVEIDFAVYVNDPQVQWTKNNLYIKGVGGRPRLVAGSQIANNVSNGKGIFVISGSGVRVENIEFANALVPDHNGAGIRQEGANLHVSACKFDGNEMGILCGNIANCKTIVEYSEFINGGSPANPGYQHNIYINHIDSLIFRYNYSHEAIAQGHELKSRANYNFILYNRIANEQSVDSRTIDLPNGGSVVMVGNVIEQGPNSANSNLLGYGLEGLSNPSPHCLWIHNNTFINKKTTGSFINIAAGTDTLWIKNNLFAGAKTGGLILGSPAILDSSHNLIEDNLGYFDFVNSSNYYDYHLYQSSPAVNTGMTTTKNVFSVPLQPEKEYVDTCSFLFRNNGNYDGITDIGAFEYFVAVSVPEPSAESSLLYPNPCKESLFLEYSDPKSYEIYATDGSLLLKGEGNQISVKSLSPGFYFLRLQSGKVIRFTKE